MKTYFSRLHYDKTPGILDKLVLILLLPAVFFYWLVVCIRNFLYDKIPGKSEKLPVFVISIGNLTTGGTGKTPVTGKIASCMTKNYNKKTAVISRGYGGKLAIKNANIISDGNKIFYDAELAGDEPFWIAENSAGTVVITGKNRFKSGQYAIDKFNCEVLILDDGFQHRKLHRDLNLLLVDSDKVFGNNLLLPAGPLRESVSQIKRADKVVIVNKNPYKKESSEKINYLREMFRDKYGKTSCVCEFVPEEIIDIISKEPVSELNKAIAVSGIAQPESFFDFLEEKGIHMLSRKVFSDHYSYKEEDIEALLEEAGSLGAEAVITTEKDAVKIRQHMEDIEIKIPVCALKLGINLDIEDLIEPSIYELSGDKK